MRLTQVTATNYRCITDSGPVDIADVTCLVGKNESGKTAFLQALRRLNPVEGIGTYDDVMEYPAKGFARYKKVRDKQPATVIRAVLEFTDDELATIEERFGTGVLRSREFTVTKRYGSSSTFFELDTDEAATVRQPHRIPGAAGGKRRPNPPAPLDHGAGRGARHARRAALDRDQAAGEDPLLA
jgi:AAA ATPase domain